MSEITRYLLEEQKKATAAEKEKNRILLTAALDICNRFVAPDMYGHAMDTLDRAICNCDPRPTKASVIKEYKAGWRAWHERFSKGY